MVVTTNQPGGAIRTETGGARKTHAGSLAEDHGKKMTRSSDRVVFTLEDDLQKLLAIPAQLPELTLQLAKIPAQLLHLTI